MLKTFFLVVAIAVLNGCSVNSTQADNAIRIDGSSASAAEASFARMLAEANPQQRQELTLALVKLHFDGVKSAVEIVGNPELQNPTVAGIRDRVDGLTAEEFIALADEVTGITLTVE